MTSGATGGARGRAGHEQDPGYADEDLDLPAGEEREGDYVDTDVVDPSPEATREGDYTDKDVPDDDPDTPAGSYVRSDPG